MSLPSSNPASIIGAGGGDYTTLSAWEADLDDATWAADYTAQVTGLTADNSTIYLDVASQSAGYICRIEAASGQEADGTDAKGAQVDSPMNIYGVSEFNLEIHGIEFHTAGKINYVSTHADSTHTYTKCVWRDISGKPVYIGSGFGDAAIRFGVCLFRNFSSSGIELSDSSMTTEAQVLNCTFYDIQYGGVAETNGTFTSIKNCVSVCDEVSSSYTDYYSVPSNMSYCADSGDNTATGTGSIHTAARADEWTAYATDDFTIKDVDAHIYHAGTPISGESWFPSTDLAGTTWDATNPSMGCFEFVTTGGLTKDLSDTITMSDSISLKLIKSFSDSISTSDGISKNININKSDVIVISDEIIKSLGLTQSDSINLSDIISKSILINKSDTINMSDNFNALVALILNLSDTVNLSDSISKEINLFESDEISLSDEIIKSFGLTQSDIINMADNFSTDADVIIALLNFVAKNRTFNFNAKPKTFNFKAKNKTFNFNAKSRGSS